MKNPLRAIEEFLQERFEGVGMGVDEVQPLDLVRQIEREIDRQRKVFVDGKVLVPHRIVVHLLAPTPAKAEEYEALFTAKTFSDWVARYVEQRGYQLLDHLRVGMLCHAEPDPRFGGRACFLEFSWPQVGADPGEVTVVFDPRDHSKVLATERGPAELEIDAWLEVVEGEAVESPVRISRRITNIGRTRHVLSRGGRGVSRVNHLAFCGGAGAGGINQTVSRSHAQIRCDGHTLLLVDQQSQNGTRIERGGQVLAMVVGTPTTLELQDVIQLGRARVRVRATAKVDGI